MSILPVHQMIQQPDYYGALQGGIKDGAARKAAGAAAEQDSAFKRLAPGIIGGDPAAFAEGAALDPTKATELQGAGDSQMKRLRGAAKYMEGALATKDPNQINGAWQAVRPFLAQNSGGQMPPEMWDDAMTPKLQQVLAQTAFLDQQGAGGSVQSTYIDAQGQRVAIMRDGSTQVLGANAPNNQIIDTGNGFYGVNKGNLSAAPVIVGGQPKQGAPAPQAAPGPQSGTPFTIDPSLPPEVQASIRNNEQAWAEAPDGASVNLPPSNRQPVPAQGGQLMSAPKVGATKDSFAPMSSDEVAQAGLPPGTSAQRNLTTGQVQVLNRPPAQSTSNGGVNGQKLQQGNAMKLAQFTAAERAIDRLDTAAKAIAGNKLLDGGPMDSKVLDVMPEGQELEQAAASLLPILTALTRVPGVGSQSDLESRLATLQMPSTRFPPEVNKRAAVALRAYMRDLKAAMQNNQPQQAANPAQAGGGWSIQRVD